MADKIIAFEILGRGQAHIPGLEDEGVYLPMRTVVVLDQLVDYLVGGFGGQATTGLLSWVVLGLRVWLWVLLLLSFQDFRILKQLLLDLL